MSSNLCYSLVAVHQICIEDNILYMDDLIDVLNEKGSYDLLYFVCKHPKIIDVILDSRRHKHNTIFSKK